MGLTPDRTRPLSKHLEKKGIEGVRYNFLKKVNENEGVCRLV
jgi:hypothetical protein